MQKYQALGIRLEIELFIPFILQIVYTFSDSKHVAIHLLRLVLHASIVRAALDSIHDRLITSDHMVLSEVSFVQIRTIQKDSPQH